ncbi:probable calcium-binding protein CML23 [Aplysia californica]|uniref:Probable calcium-binding protein CML23 n=1 Tax=Aplysia californica TaxID=6500 RepID=A0ABM1AFD9_APLCA|nr:probable calcium-binding protein CML23 [Aplysia californica]
MASLLVVRGAGLGKSSEHAVHDVTGSDGDIHPFLRVARSSTANMVFNSPELKGRFTRWFDHNDNGKAEFDEVRDYLRRFKPNISPNAVAAFIRRRDADGNGMIDFIPEYVEDLTTPDFTLEAANEWFQLQDTNDDGYVSEFKSLYNQ